MHSHLQGAITCTGCHISLCLAHSGSSCLRAQMCLVAAFGLGNIEFKFFPFCHFYHESPISSWPLPPPFCPLLSVLPFLLISFFVPSSLYLLLCPASIPSSFSPSFLFILSLLINLTTFFQIMKYLYVYVVFKSSASNITDPCIHWHC
jgi:hypothetical protein